MKQQRSTRWLRGLLLGVFVFGLVFAIVVPVATLRATPIGPTLEDGSFVSGPKPPVNPGTVLDQLGNTWAEGKALSNKIWERIKQETDRAFTYSLFSSLEMMSRTFAHDIAVKVAQGKDGLQSLRDPRTWNEIYTDTLYSGAGEFIGSFSQNFFGDTSILCNPDPRIRLFITIQLFRAEKPTPKCDFRAIQESYRNLAEQSPADWTRRLQAGFEPNQTDAGALLFAMQKLEEHKVQKIESDFKPLSVEFSGRYLDDTRVSGWVRTARSDLQTLVDKGLFTSLLDDQKDQAYTGALLGSTIAPLVGQFTQSLVAEAMQIWLKDLWGLKDPCDIKNKHDTNSDGTNDSSLSWCDDSLSEEDLAGGGYGSGLATDSYTSQQQARDTFASLLVPKIKIGGEYNIIFDLTACPPQNPAPNNCAMSQRFADAVVSRLTVQEAVDQNFIDPSLAFGYSAPLSGDEPDVNSGYGMSAIKKLRKYRIVPIGWELAADAIRAQAIAASNITTEQADITYSSIAPVPLGQLLKDFYKTGGNTICDRDSGVDANGDPESPYCGLVDPNWVLKAPQQKCTATVYGPELLASGNRLEYCAESQDCIAEDESGNCAAWGHCTRERNLWWFDGDECSPQYASCQTFSRVADSRDFSYLKNSLQYASCSAENTGCQWYSVSQSSIGTWDANDRVYLDRDAARCSDDAIGCSEFARSYPGSGSNLVKNGSFEDFVPVTTGSGSQAVWFGWSPVSGTALSELVADTTTGAAEAQTALSLAGGRGVEQLVDTGYSLGSRQFTFAFMLKDCSEDTVVSFGSVTKTLGEFVSGDLNTWRADQRGSWQNYSLTYTFPAGVSGRDIRLRFVGDTSGLQVSTTPAGRRCLVDAVRVTEGAGVAPYAAYASQNRTYLKQAPDYLTCDGSPTQPAECGSYAPTCSAEDVGCQQYTALADDSITPGVVKSEDYCPAACVGYATYRQTGSNFFQPQFPLYLIPSTATQCTAAEAGCEEFTNLDSVAAGGEGRERYSFLRRCQKDSLSGDCRPFYTWEGSDETGYRLRLFTLKADNPNSSTESPLVVKEVTFWSPETSQFVTTSNCQPLYGLTLGDVGYDPELTPNCKEFYSADGHLSYRLLDDTVLCTEQCHPYQLTKPASGSDSYQATSCQASGGFTSQCTGIAPAACSGIGGVVYNDTCYNVGASQCAATGGRFDDFGGSCRYLGTPEASRACTAVGCQEYRGNFSGAGTTLFQDDFERGALGWTGGTLASDNYAVAGHAYGLFTGGINDPGAAFLVPGRESARQTAGTVRGQRSYLVTFWARAAVDGTRMRVKFSGAPIFDASRTFAPITTSFSSEWRRYQLGPVYVDWTDANDYLVFTRHADDSGTIYLDNLQLQEIPDIQYLVRDSWNTDPSCDRNQAGVDSPQFMLGCAAYKDGNNQIQNLKSFSRLCGQNAIGCEALIDTHNSLWYGAEAFNATCSIGAVCQTDTGCPCAETLTAPTAGSYTACTVAAGESSCRYTRRLNPTAKFTEEDTREVAADRFVYLVNRPEFACDAADKGCSALGQFAVPRRSEDSILTPRVKATNPACGDGLRNISSEECDDGNTVGGDGCSASCKTEYSATAVAVQNNPDEYSTDLCSGGALWCQEFNGGTTGLSPIYFKDTSPGTDASTARTCDYRQSPTGEFCWYQVGTTNLCPRAGVEIEEKCELRPVGGQYCWRVKGSDQDPCSVPPGGQACVTTPAADAVTEVTIVHQTTPGCGGQSYRFLGAPQDGSSFAASDAVLSWSLNCPADQSGCTRFVDPLDSDYQQAPLSGVQKNEYYYIDNDQLDRESCNNSVSQKDGCVLFRSDNQIDWAAVDRVGNWQDDVDRDRYTAPVKYSAQATWDKGQTVSGRSVNPIDCLFPGDDSSFCAFRVGDSEPRDNDTNELLKVRRDRVCAEWSDCRESYEAFDPNIGKMRTICLDTMACTSLEPNELENGVLKCTSAGTGLPVEGEDWSATQTTHQTDTEGVNSLGKYLRRDLGWKGYEYSGYTIPGLRPVWSLQQIPFGVCQRDSTISGACRTNDQCPNGYTCNTKDFAIYLLGYVRYNDFLDRLEYKGISNDDDFLGKACRGYPEETSPFKQSLSGVPQFNHSAFCDSKDVNGRNACDCHYEKVTRDNATGYFTLPDDFINLLAGSLYTRPQLPLNQTINLSDSGNPTSTPTFQIAAIGTAASTTGQVVGTLQQLAGGTPVNPVGSVQRICTSGTKIGQACTVDNGINGNWQNDGCMPESEEPEYFPEPGYYDPDTGGTRSTPSDYDVCQKIDQRQQYIGWRGYCLEEIPNRFVDGDTRRHPCLTWLPIDLVKGEPDIYSNRDTAGFDFANHPAPYWSCSESQGFASIKYSTKERGRPSDPVSGDWRIEYQWEALSNDLCDADDAGCYYAANTDEYDFGYEDGNPNDGTVIPERLLAPSLEFQGGGHAEIRRLGWKDSSGVRRIQAYPEFLAYLSSHGIAEDDIEYIEIVPYDENDSVPSGPSGGSQPLTQKDWLRRPFRLSKATNWTFGWCGVDPRDNLELAPYKQSLDDPSSFYCANTDGDGHDFPYQPGDTITGGLKDFFRYDNQFGRRPTGVTNHCIDLKNFNAFALEAVFENNRFAGWRSGVCDGSSGGGEMLIKEITFKLKESCTEMARTTNGSEHTAARWGDSFFNTNTMWEQGTSPFTTNILDFAVQFVPFARYKTAGSPGLPENDAAGGMTGTSATTRRVVRSWSGTTTNFGGPEWQLPGAYGTLASTIDDAGYFSTSFLCVGQHCNVLPNTGVCRTIGLIPPVDSEEVPDDEESGAIHPRAREFNGGEQSCDPSSGEGACPAGQYCVGSAAVWIGPAGSGQARLQMLFAKSFNIQRWNDTTRRYESQPSTANWDVRRRGEAPVVRGVTSPEGGAGAPGTISVNYNVGNPNIPVVLYGQGDVFITFYAYNDNGAQMPLRRITVDYDGDISDGSNQTSIGGDAGGVTQLANYKPKCNNTPGNFGDQSGVSCDERFLSFEYTYYWPGDAEAVSLSNYSATCKSNVAGSLPYLRYADGGAYNGPCLVYKPRVQVIDNWGICAADSNQAFYVDHPENFGVSYEQSACNHPARWTAYGGNILVLPPDWTRYTNQ